MIDWRKYAKAGVAGVAGGIIAALTLVATGETSPGVLLAAAAGGFVVAAGPVWATPNRA